MNIQDVKWLSRFYRMAANEIRQWSKDPDRKVGALAVSPDGRSLSPGYNGFPKGINDSELRLIKYKDLKNKLTVHAEANAILNAKANLTGWYLFSTYFPCTDCALLIIQSGIGVVVAPPPNNNSSRFSNQLDSQYLLEEAGIKIIGVTEKWIK